MPSTVKATQTIMRVFILLALTSLGLCASPAPCADSPVTDVSASPAIVRLVGPKSSYSLLVQAKNAAGDAVDLTHAARYQSTNRTIATVSATGVVRAVADGKAEVVVEVAGQKRSVTVEVSDFTRPHEYHFENDIVPLFTRFGCNSAGCHGNAAGQNGFKLSVFGFDPPADYAALVKESRGRRVLATAPEASLLVAKAAGLMPHGGGIRIPRGTPEFDTLRGWITAGMPLGDPAAPSVAAIRIEPGERLLAMKAQQQLRVIARYANGRQVDVTGHAKFQTNNDALASVSADGLVTAGDTPGEVAVMASFMGAVDTFRAIVPRPDKIVDYPKLPENNFIDKLVFQKLKKLNILPSDLCDDADYLRRVHLDVIGTLPTAAEARRFLTDKHPDRRARLVDELLERPEFADYWALKWADLLRVDRDVLGHKRAYAFHRWIRDSLAKNKPLDQFAREVVAADGILDENGPANFFKVVPKPGEAASSLAQIFLGIRIACAECHHHPFDRWGQVDYYGMQAFFAQVSVRPSSRGDILQALGEPQTKHPRTGATVPPQTLGSKAAAALPQGDRRPLLAAWLTAGDNPWFARNLANRTWAHFLGRGLVDPVDDVRDTNPPSNPELLDALAKQVVASKFDFKQLIKTIIASRIYQLSAHPNKTNERDEINYSRALFRRIDAEVLLDMVSQTTGIGEKFPGMPAGYRAIQLWDSKVNHYFLKLFGRPARASACECERNIEPGVAQVLHFLNSPEIQAKISHERGTVARLVKAKADNGALADELYLTFFSRLPTEKERAAAVRHLERVPAERRQAAEDLAWGMLNSLEFVFNH
jgi:Protein of unknown function (DUF1549)/Protein of unknown function (DUF1553)/Bacterial Ig-like domain (group 2)